MTVAQRMARLLASSRYAAGLLLRQPETVAWLGNGRSIDSTISCSSRS